MKPLALALLAAVAFSLPATARAPAAPPSAPAAPRFTAPEYVMGSPKAPTTVVEYLSAACTHCAHFDAEVFPQIKAKYIDTGKIRWVVRELLAGPEEVAAAGFVLARCTGRDHYWSTLESVFRAQNAIFKTGDVRGGLLKAAHDAGLSDKQFDACMSDDAAFREMDARNNAAVKAGVESTPTFIVNGRKYDKGALTMAEFEKALAGKKL